MDVAITEASLFFYVTKQPKTYVGKEMPYVVNTIGENTERVVSSNENYSYPIWITKLRQNVLKFIYSIPFEQDIECNYSHKHRILIMHNIKYKNFKYAEKYVNSVFNMIDTKYENTPVIKYKATAKIKICAIWDVNVLADIITNDCNISQIMAVRESINTLGNKRVFSIALSIKNGESVCRVAFTYKNEYVFAMISKLSSEEYLSFVTEALKLLFETYVDNVSSYSPVPLLPVHTRASNIETLRNQLPELFVNNYTRECPMLPIMISHDEAELIHCQQRVILYPLNSDKGRYYTAPEGYFVGLKRNRLSNKDEFPYLVTCYLQDHMKRTSSDTYKYYYNCSINNYDNHDNHNNYNDHNIIHPINYNSRRPLPKAIYDPRYYRIKARSFIDALESATNVKIDYLPWFPQITKQEMWDKSDEEIMDAINGKTTDGLSCLYRYFEELIQISIHVVVIKKGNFEPLIPRHKGQYVWEPPYPMHIVIFENYKKTYGTNLCLYSYLARNRNTIFNSTDEVVSYLISQKNVDSVKPMQFHNITSAAREQIIDRNGKCKTIITEQGLHIDTYTRPLNLPVAVEQTCFFDSHIRKMNVVRKQMGIQTIDLYKRSTHSVLYFPNDVSFKYYVSTKKKQPA
jgi:hypothetical protein